MVDEVVRQSAFGSKLFRPKAFPTRLMMMTMAIMTMLMTMTMKYLWSELQTGTDMEWKCKRQQIHGILVNIKYQHDDDDDDGDDLYIIGAVCLFVCHKSHYFRIQRIWSFHTFIATFRTQRNWSFPCFLTLSVFKGFCRFTCL